MSIMKKKRGVKLYVIFLIVCIVLLAWYGYLHYSLSLYERLQVLFEKDKKVFYQIKDICNNQEIERGEIVVFINNGDMWLFETSIDNLDESEFFEDNDYMFLIEYLDQQIGLSKIFFAKDEIRFVVNIKDKRYAEFRYTEEKWFLMNKTRAEKKADLDDGWFLLNADESYELRIAEEDERELQKKVFRENIDLFNEYVKLSKKLVGPYLSLNYKSALDINLERVGEEEELNRFKDLTDELRDLIGFERITTGDSEMEFRFGINNNKDATLIKFSEASDFQTDYMERDHIDEVLAPDWYYMVYFYYNLESPHQAAE